MSYIPPRERTFALNLASEFENCYLTYAIWLKRLLDRLGPQIALGVWRRAFDDFDDAELREILSSGWAPAPGPAADAQAGIDGQMGEFFAIPVQGITLAAARELIERTPPIPQIRQHLPSLHLQRQTTTYETLHLFREGIARLAEALIDLQGKQGEFIAFEIIYRLTTEGVPEMDVDDFLASFTAPFPAPNRISAGMDYEILSATEDEVIMHVTACEWVRYYQERHPRVGYLMSCCTDGLNYHLINPRLRFQRITTLMEGGALCDFRIYALEVPGEQR